MPSPLQRRLSHLRAHGKLGDDVHLASLVEVLHWWLIHLIVVFEQLDLGRLNAEMVLIRSPRR